MKERCIIEEHRHLAAATGEPTAGHPRKQGVHVRRRRCPLEEAQPGRSDAGYEAGGGGGHKGGGGVRAVLNEKKMTRRRR